MLAGDDQALATFSRLANRKALDEAARRFLEGLKQGIDEDTLIALELGAEDVTSMTDLQREYKDKIKARLEKRVEELRREDEEVRKKLSRSLVLGKEAYSCGEYPASVRLLEAAVEELGTNSALGGEAQLWLALAYQACGREQDCIDTYKFMETNHPNPKLRKQAADLRYIMEAPKLEISEEERVKIPLISSDTWRTKDRKGSYSTSRLPKPPVKQRSSYWDRATWDLPPVPSLLPDKWYVRVAWALLLVGVTVYVNSQLKQ